MSYTQKDFDRLIDEMWKNSGALLRSKGAEYATDAERLGNFKRIAAAEGRRPSQVALTLFLKHTDSISQAVQKGNVPFEMQSIEGKEGLEQRFCDAINYLFLMAACIQDEQGRTAVAAHVV